MSTVYQKSFAKRDSETLAKSLVIYRLSFFIFHLWVTISVVSPFANEKRQMTNDL